MLPVVLLQLPTFDWRSLTGSLIARLAFAYLGYFLLSALWSDGFTWPGFADLLRVSLLLLLFFLVIVHLASHDSDFVDRLFFWFAATAGATALAVFAATALDLLPSGWRLAGFGLATHPVIGATLYGVALLVAAFDLLARAKDRRWRLVWVAVVALSASFMLLSSSRGPLLALVVALGLAIADRRLAVAAVALMAVGVALGSLTDLQTIELLYERAPSGHFSLWQQALTAIAERPWLGHGSLADTVFEAKHGPGRSPHNLLLANHFYGGLPATLLLGALLLLAALEAWRARQDGRPISCCWPSGSPPRSSTRAAWS